MSASKQISDYVFFSKYAQWNFEAGRRNTPVESFRKVMDMHRMRFATELDPEAFGTFSAMANDIESWLLAGGGLGSQRALQYAGAPALAKHSRVYNCLHESTRFVTVDGVKAFSDFRHGDETVVLTHAGNWKKAVVKSYGMQKMHDIVIGRGKSTQIVRATADHRWIKSDGSHTTSLTEGDTLARSPRVFDSFNYDDADVDERVWWAYGFVYGDGTCVKGSDGEYKSSMVRLCGHKRRFAERFSELGFSHSHPPSADGDPVYYTGRYLKTLPWDAPARIRRAFIAGYLDADGGRNSNTGSPSPFVNIQTSDDEAAAFIRTFFPAAGVYIVSETPVNRDTNYGRHDAVLFTLTQGQGQTSPHFTVRAMNEAGEFEAWCLEVEDDHSFVLESGLPTGNCWMSYCDRPRFFQEAFWLLLCGGGTGFSVQRHHVARLPPITRPRGNGATRTHVVEDTIEGWADALGVLLSSYFDADDTPFPAVRGTRVVFDYDRVRPEGAPLSWGGLAPGPEPLRRSLDKIRELLDRCLDAGLTALRPIDAYDVVMHASDAVLAGGVRRSASICVFSADDEDMLLAKTGEWYRDNPQRGRSNNSAMFVRGLVTRAQYDRVMTLTRQWGEPAFYFANSTEDIPNPCVEVGTRPVHWLTGASGWQACNLSTVNVEACATARDFFHGCRMASYLGTIQASYTDFSYLGAVSEEITRREALLGVSLTGMTRNPELAFDELALASGAEIVKVANAEMAALLGINVAARTTCLKPEGTGSLFLGTTPGIHADHSRRYIRRIQASANEPPMLAFAAKNPRAVVDSRWSRDGGKLVCFAVEAPPGALTKADVVALDMLERVRLVKRAWVDAGKRVDACVDPGLSHNVSNTVDVRESEWGKVTDYIWKHRDDFAGVSFIADVGDIDYAQAPFTAVLDEREIVERYGLAAMFASGLIVDAVHAFGDLHTACDTAIGGLGMGVDLDAPDDDSQRLALRRDWVRRFRQFAKRYVNGDERRASHCLKHVDNLKTWHDLRRETRDVDYATEIRDDHMTKVKVTEAMACAGGVCLI